jgi:hypothetical protein
MATTTIPAPAHRGDNPLPRRLFSREMAAALASQTVGLDAAALGGVSHSPLIHPSCSKRWSAGNSDPGLDLERPLAWSENTLGDRGAMERLQFERPEDEQIQRALTSDATGSA